MIKEGLRYVPKKSSRPERKPLTVNRIGYGFPHRMQRVSPDVALQFHDWTIPVGVCLILASQQPLPSATSTDQFFFSPPDPSKHVLPNDPRQPLHLPQPPHLRPGTLAPTLNQATGKISRTLQQGLSPMCRHGVSLLFPSFPKGVSQFSKI